MAKGWKSQTYHLISQLICKPTRDVVLLRHLQAMINAERAQHKWLAAKRRRYNAKNAINAKRASSSWKMRKKKVDCSSRLFQLIVPVDCSSWLFQFLLFISCNFIICAGREECRRRDSISFVLPASEIFQRAWADRSTKRKAARRRRRTSWSTP